jgi:hypothetical protein
MDTRASFKSLPAGNHARCAFRHAPFIFADGKFIRFQASDGRYYCDVNHLLATRIIKDLQRTSTNESRLPLLPLWQRYRPHPLLQMGWQVLLQQRAPKRVPQAKPASDTRCAGPQLASSPLPLKTYRGNRSNTGSRNCPGVFHNRGCRQRVDRTPTLAPHEMESTP